MLVFFDSIKTPISATAVSEGLEMEKQYKKLLLEVSGATTITIKVQGCVKDIDEHGVKLEDSECSWTDIGVKSVTTETIAGTITSNGVSIVSIAGFNRIRVNVTAITGEATIVANAF